MYLIHDIRTVALQRRLSLLSLGDDDFVTTTTPLTDLEFDALFLIL